MSDSFKSLIQLYKKLDEAKLIIEDIINEIGSDNPKILQTIPEDIQQLIDISLELTPEQRKSLMRFIESLKQN